MDRARPVPPQGESSPCPGCAKTTSPPIPPPPRLRAGPGDNGDRSARGASEGQGPEATFSPSPAATQPSRPSDGASTPHSAAGAQFCPPRYSAGHSPAPQRGLDPALGGHRRDRRGGRGRELQAGERSGWAQANGRAS